MNKLMTALALAMIFGATAFAQEAAPVATPETPAEEAVQAETPRGPRGRRGQRPQLTEEQKAEWKARMQKRIQERMTCKECGKVRKPRHCKGPRPECPMVKEGKAPEFCGCPRPQLTEEQKAEMKARFEARRAKWQGKGPKGKKGPRGKGPRGPQTPAPEAPAPAPAA